MHTVLSKNDTALVLIGLFFVIFAVVGLLIKPRPAEASINPKPAPPAEEPGGALTISAIVTGYCPCTICCGAWGKTPVSSGFRTAADRGRIREGQKFVAAPKSFKFGTYVSIPGYNNGEPVKVRDRGFLIDDTVPHKRVGKKLLPTATFDCYFDKHEDAVRFGRRSVSVTVQRAAVAN